MKVQRKSRTAAAEGTRECLGAEIGKKQKEGRVTSVMRRVVANGDRGGQSGNGNHLEPYCSIPRMQEWREGRCKEPNELETRFGGKMQSKSGVRLPCLEFWVPQL